MGFCGMKTVVLIALLTTALAGCAQRYKITLTNGNSISTSNKPKLNAAGNTYVYKDGQGKEASVFAGKVTEIAPE